MKKFLFTLFIVFGICFNAQAQTLSAKVNRQTLPEGETFMLTLEYDGGQSNDTPDLSVLDKDFNIYSVGNAYRTNIINGQMSQTLQWNLVLMPKISGEITIPAINLGNIKSNPLNINIIPSGQSVPQSKLDNQAPQNEPKFAINGKVSNKAPYVQQQIDYTLSIYDNGALQGEEPVFMSNSGNDWIIKRISEPLVSTKNINGENLREITFKYALFPQKSGKLIIPEVRFNGFYLTKNKQGFDPFSEIFGQDLMMSGFGMSDMFAARNPVILKTKPIEVEVKPIPAQNEKKWWLPATDVSLFAEWEPSTPVFKLGDAVNRTIYLKATGVIENQLPEIKFPNTLGLKQYPEKPITQTLVENNEVVSLKKINMVYIPNQVGDLTLPSIEVDWFNVKTNKLEKALLPALKIEVTGTMPPQTKIKKEQPKADIPLKEVQQDEEDLLFTILMVGGAFVLGIGLSYLFFRPKNKKNKTSKEIPSKKTIIKAAQDKDFRLLRDALLHWGEAKYKLEKINNLKELGELSNNKEFSAQIEKINSALYANKSNDFDEKSFINAFEKICLKKQTSKKNEALLPNLYK